MTVAEVLLWKKLKGRQVDGYDFDRQRPIGEYIVDYYCKDLKLAIEIDGISHDYKPKDDQKRQQQIEKLGVRFLRFWEQEVKTDSCAVVGKIREWIRQHGTHPRPLQGGEK